MAILKARDLTLVARLKQVSRLHFRGFSNRKIAQEMEYDEASVRRDLAIIKDQIHEHPDISNFLSDVIARTGEELTKLAELEAEQWKLLEWCSEEVVQVDGFGNPLPEMDPETGQIVKRNGAPVPQKGPRKPSGIIACTQAIQGISKQRAELLKLVGNKVDISVKLQVQEQTQARILEVIRNADSALYGQIYRELQIIAETAESTIALPPGVKDAIDAEFTAEMTYADA